MSGRLYIAGAPMLALLGLPASTPPREPHCHFCGTQVDATKSIKGRGPLIQTVKQEPILDPSSGKTIGFEEISRFSSSKILSCDGCSLRLADTIIRDVKGAPLRNRVGEIVSTGNRTKYPD